MPCQTPLKVMRGSLEKSPVYCELSFTRKIGVAMKTSLLLAAALALLGSSVPIVAAEMLKAEPERGTLAFMAEALVDDGTCPKGQVKKVIGGNFRLGVERKNSCVPRPK